MKLIASVAGAALLLAMPAAAQNAQPSPAALGHAQHMMDAMHMDKMMAQMGEAMMKPMVGQMYARMTPKQRARAEAFQEAIWAEMHDLTPKLTAAMVRIYAANLTETELAEADAFYSSPTGQAILAKTPLLTQQLIPVVMAEMPSIMSRSVDRYCAKVICTKQERAAFTQATAAMTSPGQTPR